MGGGVKLNKTKLDMQIIIYTQSSLFLVHFSISSFFVLGILSFAAFYFFFLL